MNTIRDIREQIKAVGLLSLLAGLFLFQAATAHAVPVRIDSLWQTGPAVGVIGLATSAFLDTSAITGVGTETVQVTRFDLDFTINSNPSTVVGTALLDPTNPRFLGNFWFAEFADGELFRFQGGLTLIVPETIQSGRITTVGRPPGGMAHLVGFGQTNWALVPGSSVVVPLNPGGTPVPEPSTWLVFGSGIAGLLGFKYRRRKQTA